MNTRHAAALALVVWCLVYPNPYIHPNDLNYYPEDSEIPAPPTLRQKLIDQRQQLIDQRERLLVDLSGFLSRFGPNLPGRKDVEARILTFEAQILTLNKKLSVTGFLDWRKIMRFDTERECETERATHGVSAKCMASDDPRLKSEW